MAPPPPQSHDGQPGAELRPLVPSRAGEHSSLQLLSVPSLIKGRNGPELVLLTPTFSQAQDAWGASPRCPVPACCWMCTALESTVHLHSLPGSPMSGETSLCRSCFPKPGCPAHLLSGVPIAQLWASPLTFRSHLVPTPALTDFCDVEAGVAPHSALVTPRC